MKLPWIFILGVFTLLFDAVAPANILVVTFFSSKSHKITYLPLIEELGKRGHQITMVSPIKPMKPLQNVKEIFTFDMDAALQKGGFNPFELKEKGTTFHPGMMMPLVMQLCNDSLALPEIQALTTQKFDLVFVQPFFNECVFGLVYRIGAPMVLFLPAAVPSVVVQKIGGHFPSSFTPNFFLSYDPEMTFWQRFINFGVDFFPVIYFKLFYEPNVDAVVRERLGQDIPSVNDIYANASMVLSNGHFSLSGPRPYFPDVVDVGGIHSRPAKPVPKDLEDFIKKGNDGFILFSMGSAIKGDMMPEYKRKLILNVFSRLKQQVLWKWESETMPDLPKNVKLSKWLPQQDLLGHPDIKMFITHCGGGSTEESIYHGVPLVGIPMFADQFQNAKVAREKGFMVDAQWEMMTEESFEAAINEILNNPKYRENVKQLSALFKDRPQDPLELGVYWIEYVIRHRGAPQLRNVGRKLNVFQYHSIDVISAYLALITGILWLLYAIIKLVCRKLFCRSSSNVSVSKKNK